MLLVFSTPPLPTVIPIAKNFRGGLFRPQESFHEGGDSVCPVLVLHFPQLKHAPVVAWAPRPPGPCPLSREPLTVSSAPVGGGAVPRETRYALSHWLVFLQFLRPRYLFTAHVCTCSCVHTLASCLLTGQSHRENQATADQQSRSPFVFAWMAFSFGSTGPLLGF